MDDNDGINEPEHDEAVPSASKGKTRDLIAFWIFGLCNNYGYVVMLTAAIDIINSDTVSKLIETFVMTLTFFVSVVI